MLVRRSIADRPTALRCPRPTSASRMPAAPWRCGALLLPALLAGSPARGAVLMGPYVQNIKPDSARVLWEASTQEATARVEYGQTPGYGQTVTATYRSVHTGYHVYTAELRNLKPGTIYHYRVTSGATTGGDLTLRTAPPIGATGFRYYVIGASSDFRNDLALVADTILADLQAQPKQRQSFLVSLGGLVASGGTYSQWGDRFFDPLQPLLERLPVYVALSEDEDTGSLAATAFITGFFDFPSSESGSSAEQWYSFGYGNLHAAFYSLFTSSGWGPGTPQWSWLLSDLAAAAANPKYDWRVAAMHMLPWSWGKYKEYMSPAPGLRAFMHPRFVEHGVSLAMGAHNRVYARYEPVASVSYITAGLTAEDTDTDIDAPWPGATMARLSADQHWCLVDVERLAMTVRCYTLYGDLLDWTTIGPYDQDAPPLADAGADQSTEVDWPVTLDGRASIDPEGSSLTYAWRLLDGPEPVALDAASEALAGFTPLVPGLYRLALTVSDGANLSTPDEVLIAVGPRVQPFLTLAIGDGVEGRGPLTGVLLVSQAPDVSLVVQLSSSDPGEASVPSTVTIPAGRTWASFDVALPPDGVIDGPQLVLITAGADGHEGDLEWLTVSDGDAAGQVVLKAAADAGLDSAQPTVALGAGPLMGWDNSPNTELSLLRFNVSGVRGPVQRATLRLYVIETGDPGELRAAPGTWDELSVTFNTRPTYDSTNLGLITATAYERWTELDVTSLVSGNGQLNWAIHPRGSNRVVVQTREHPSGKGPELVVNYQALPLTIESPNGGEVWSVGQTVQLRWTSLVPIPTVSLDVSRDGGGTWQPIASGIVNADSYAWTVTAPDTAQALVRVRDDAGTDGDVSDAVFTIRPAYLHLLYPNGGEIIAAGSTIDVRWEHVGPVGTVALQYRDLGLDWTTIASGLDGASDRYTWLVPDVPTDTARLRVASTGADVSDESDGPFRIVSPSSHALTLSVPSEAAETAGTLLGSVSLPAPGTAPLDVTLVSSDTTKLIVPSSLILPAGALYVDFTITVLDNQEEAGDQEVTIVATAPAYAAGLATIVIRDDEATRPPPSGGGCDCATTGEAPWGAALLAFAVLLALGPRLGRRGRP